MQHIPQKKRGDLIDAPYLNAIAAAVNSAQMASNGAHLKRPGVSHGALLPRSISPTGNARVRGVISASGVSPSIDYQAPGVRTLDAPASSPEGQQTIPLPETEGVQTYCAVITTDSTGTPTGTTYEWLTTVPADILWDPVANTGGTLYRPICTLLPDAMWKSGLPQSTYALGHSGDLDMPSIPYNLPADAGSEIGAAILGTRIGQSWPLRRIAAGSGISITEGDNAITIEAVGSIDPPTPVELANYNNTRAGIPDAAGIIASMELHYQTSISIENGVIKLPFVHLPSFIGSSLSGPVTGVGGCLRGLCPIPWNETPDIAEGIFYYPSAPPIPSLPSAINLVTSGGGENGSIPWEDMAINQSYLIAVDSSGANLGELQIFLNSKLTIMRDAAGNLSFGLQTELSS